MLDEFWNAWISPLPDVLSADWFGAVRDVISLLVGGVGTYLAWLAIKMGRDNDKVTEKQVELMASQKELLERLGDFESEQLQVLKAQAEITARQEALALRQSQLGLKCKMVLQVSGNRGWLFVEVRGSAGPFRVEHWRLSLPNHKTSEVSFAEPGRPPRTFVPSETGAYLSSLSPLEIGSWSEQDCDIGPLVFDGPASVMGMRFDMSTGFRSYWGDVDIHHLATAPVKNPGLTP